MTADHNGGPGDTPTRREQSAPGSTSVPESDTAGSHVAQARDDHQLAALVADSRRRRLELEAHLRDQLQQARAAGDHTTVAAIARRLDRAYVGKAHQRAADPVIRRYRRLLAATA